MGKLVEAAAKRNTGISFSDKIRFFVMVFVLLVLMVHFYTQAGKMGAKNSKEPWYVGHDREFKGEIKAITPEEQLKQQKELTQPPYNQPPYGHVSPLMVDPKQFPVTWTRDDLLKNVIHHVKYFEDKAWIWLLHKTATMTQEEISAAVEAQNKEEKITYTHVLKVPEKLPGLYVDFYGSIVRLRRKDVFIENEIGIKSVWEGQLYDKDYRIISFQILDPPTDLYMWDPVSLQGIFYKGWVYEDTKGDMQPTPLIIGRTLVPLKIDKEKPITWVHYSLGILVLLGTITLIIGVRVEAKRSEKFRLEMQEKRKETAQKQSSKIEAKKLSSTENASSPPQETSAPQEPPNPATTPNPQQTTPDQNSPPSNLS